MNAVCAERLCKPVIRADQEHQVVDLTRPSQPSPEFEAIRTAERPVHHGRARRERQGGADRVRHTIRIGEQQQGRW